MTVLKDVCYGPKNLGLEDEAAEERAKEAITGLKSAVGYIRRELARRVNLRNTPEISFVLDQSIEHGVNMSRLIDEVTKDLKD